MREMNIETTITKGHMNTTIIKTDAAERALFSKSYRVSGAYTTMNFRPNEVTGERNDAAIRRLKGMIKAIEKAGIEITTNGADNAASLTEIKSYLGM